MEKNKEIGIVGIAEIARNWLFSLSHKQQEQKPSNASNQTEGNNSEKNQKSQKGRKNLLKRIKVKMEFKIPSKLEILSKNNCLKNDFNIQEQQIVGIRKQNSLDSNCESKLLMEKYQKHILKKWLGEGSEINIVMLKACSEMLSHVWYWGEISRQHAQKQLTGKPNGSFLVRDSETSGSQFTLSFRIANYTLHYRIRYHDKYWHFEELFYESIVEMIEDIMTRSTDEKFVCYVKAPSEMQPPFPVILKYPISRYSKIPQLQELCRHTIQEYINSKEEIEKLPIPVKIQQYLIEKPSLIF